MKQKFYYYELLKSVKRLLNKLKQMQETLEFKISKQTETFPFKPSINLGLDSKGMVGLTSP